MATVHIVGAGLAGLSAAVSLSKGGHAVVLHEAAKQAGGRCRSYYDPTLGLTIDNGNHLLLSGNADALGFLRGVDAPADALVGPDEAVFDFADLKSRRDYLAPLSILRAAAGKAEGAGGTIGQTMECTGPLYERLWHPVLLAALNTEPRDSDVGLAARILRETLGAGGRACKPLIAMEGLSYAFVDPAVRTLQKRGADIRFGRRLRSLAHDGGRITALTFSDGEETLGTSDSVVLALPPWVVADLLPEIPTPLEFRSIVNAHFAVVPKPGSPLFLGVVNSLTEWLFAYSDRYSVTISGADRLLDVPREDLARQIWGEIATLGNLAPELPRWQIVKEKRATFAATPAEAARRAEARTRHTNLVLAGDWTATGLPSTIEGAIRSGKTAAHAVMCAASPARGAA